MDSHDLKRHPLLENQQKTRSKDKADFEAITHLGIVYMFFGSGSTERTK
jgi:hypothetical protein